MKSVHQKDEVPGGCDAEHLKDNTEINASIVAPDSDNDKAFATARAELALRGISLFLLADGSFLACRWNLTRAFPDFRAVSAWVRQLGGSQ